MGTRARFFLFLAVVLVMTGCASAPLPDSARGPNGERLPDLCYQLG